MSSAVAAPPSRLVVPALAAVYVIWGSTYLAMRIAVEGLRRYGEHDFARDIATRWISTVDSAWRETGKMLEKYDVEERRPGGGGEYPLQDGFGWTNGVTRARIAQRQEHAASGGEDGSARPRP